MLIGSVCLEKIGFDFVLHDPGNQIAGNFSAFGTRSRINFRNQ